MRSATTKVSRLVGGLLVPIGVRWDAKRIKLRTVKLALGPPVVPFYPFLGEGSPTKIDYRKKRVHTLILTSLLEDLE